MKSSKRIVCQAVLAALSALAASAAMAQTVPALVGGGSSLVAPSIGAEISIFPAADGTATYASVGSGKGQTAFLNNDATQFGLAAGKVVHFANSDAALSSSQISSYASSSLGTTSTGGGPLIQIPYIVTPITIPLVNAPAGTGPQTTTGQTNSVALNDNDLCGIFSGKLTNWSQVTNPDNGSFYAAGPITVVVRGDGSGTTDLLTRHLAASGVCTTGTGGNSNIAFTETQTFKATLFPAGLPSNFVEATGSGGVVTALKNLGTAAGVGYVSPDYTNSFLATSTSAPAATNALAVASLRNTSTGADVVPTYQNATLALGTVALPSNPAVQTQWVPNSANPSVGYPISGTSQIIVSQCYANHSNSPTVNASVVDFLNLHYNNASNAAILHGNGFDTVPSSYASAITTDFLTGTRANLNIGNSTICGAVAGR
ncbi:Alkaline phosphatase L [Paraburkholderia sediminicola]|uniref:Alkaline phosphatase L n=1 Tax=Paraburkholderia sediminicola TaxID=458836 RepID=A0A6J4ZWY4_9BURK|nr:substrate-binding domain-containing protein [Paraburkholderia sediminicola]CAB3643650.1 Alkaline phosphatase L [Paraburkholderia sediminicola]